ncbi:uncharacterized protein LOC116215907 isoform X1 [Punica granatum]|uniref:Uncharacterized protein LOC116215907 isoform X1 n=1 Tax=Punica granatum TaxID=22663 RepID=A0A6P8ELS3_PUNGR|nr:uncharacterized protein LOC116215907 isoform X1 [Punica granatum]
MMETLALWAPPCSSAPSAMRLRAAAWDTQPRLPYNPNAPRKPPKLLNVGSPSKASPVVTLNVSPPRMETPVLELLKRHHQQSTGKAQGNSDETYMGYERWLPSPPKVEKPRSVYNAASLAYIGDCIYELYARRHFLFPPLNIDDYNDRVMSVVRCEAQDELLQTLLADNYLSAEERDILKWGKNVTTSKSRTKRRAGVAVYNRASSLETLIGYLYLKNVKRLEDIMLKLGFSSGASMDSILKDSNGGQAV